MADTFYGVNLKSGKQIVGVTQGSATAGNTVAPIELRTNDGAGVSAADVVMALEVIKAHITAGNAPN